MMGHTDAEHLRVMADVVREVWRLAQGWKRDDDTEPLAGDIFTAVSPLVAWGEENGVPSTVPDDHEPQARALRGGRVR